MKRLILVLILLVMLPVLAEAPASDAPTDNVQIEDMAETAKPSSNSTATRVTMTSVDD